MNNLFTILAIAFVALQLFRILVPELILYYRTVRPRKRDSDTFQPNAVVILPCKGIEPGIEENIHALMAQDYSKYSLIFVTESENDAAYPLIKELISESPRPARLIVAGVAVASGQKVHNQRAAVEAIGKDVEIIVFVDSDAHTRPEWLAEICAPLADPKIGATTGYRWHIPVPGNFWSILLSSWNAQAITMLGERSFFAWGGTMAMRVQDFKCLEIEQCWRSALADDIPLSNAVRRSGLRVAFVAQCLVASHAYTEMEQVLEFTTRQLKISRIYMPGVWLQTMFGFVFYSLVFWGGLIVAIADILRGSFATNLPLLLVVIVAQSACHAWLGLAIARHCLPDYRVTITKTRGAFVLMEPVMALLYLYNIVASSVNRRVVWRGIVYEMISSHETRIIRPDRDNTEVGIVEH